MALGFSLAAWCATTTALAVVGAVAQTRQHPEVAAITDPAQLPDQEIGRHFSIKPEDLPPPYTKPLATRAPE